MMFYAADDGRAEVKMPIYYAARLLAKEWIEPTDAMQTLYRTSVGDQFEGSRKDVSAFALLRPDGQWAILLLNKAHQRSAPSRSGSTASKDKAANGVGHLKCSSIRESSMSGAPMALPASRCEANHRRRCRSCRPPRRQSNCPRCQLR